MFSVRAENILLNYFIVIFIISMLFIYYSSLVFLVLFIFLIFSGILLYFDKFFYFKISFLLGLLISLFFLFSLPNLNILILLVLIISLSQISLLVAYLILLAFINFYFEFLEIYLVISVSILTILLSIFWGMKKLNKEIIEKLFSSEARHYFVIHDICNLCSIVFLKNKDKNLEPILNKVRLKLYEEKSSSKISAGGLLRMVIYFLDFDYNLKVRQNFFIFGRNLSWFSFFYNLLCGYVKKGSTIVVDKNSMVFVLKKCDMNYLKKFLKNHIMNDNVEIRGNQLRFIYGK